MKKVINLGVIGCGAVFRLMHLPVIHKLKDKFKIVKIYDSDTHAYQLTKTAMKKNGYKFDKSIWARNENEIFNDNSIDAVAVLTGINSHYYYTVKSLNSSKDVFLEKPAALTIKEISKMNTLAKRKKKVVQVGMVLRHSKWYYELKKIIDSKKFGKVLWMHWLETRPFDPMNWRYDSKNKNGDAVIHDKAVHQINLFNAFAGSMPDSAFAMAGQYMLSDTKTKKLRAFNREALLKGDSSDNLMSIIKYKNGVKADLVISYVSPQARESRFVIQLEKAKIVAHFETFVKRSILDIYKWESNPSVIYLFKDNDSLPVPWKTPMSYPLSKDNLVFYDEYKEDSLHPGSTKQWEEFYDAVTITRKPLTGLKLAEDDTKVIAAIYKSVKQNKLIKV